MSYTICIPARAKTGTFSIWSAYRNHPEIAVSKDKETLQNYNEKEIKNYIQKTFNITKTTKVLLDCSVDVFFSNPDIIDKVRNLDKINRFCVLYILRDPLDRCISEIYNTIYDVFVRKIPKKHVFITSEGKIDINLLERHITSSLCESRIIELVLSKIKLTDILFLPFDQIFTGQQKVFSFLQIDKNCIIHEVRVNQRKHRIPTIEYLKVIKDVANYIKKNEKYLRQLSNIEKDLFSKKYFNGEHE